MSLIKYAKIRSLEKFKSFNYSIAKAILSAIIFIVVYSVCVTIMMVPGFIYVLARGSNFINNSLEPLIEIEEQFPFLEKNRFGLVIAVSTFTGGSLALCVYYSCIMFLALHVGIDPSIILLVLIPNLNFIKLGIHRFKSFVSELITDEKIKYDSFLEDEQKRKAQEGDISLHQLAEEGDISICESGMLTEANRLV